MLAYWFRIVAPVAMLSGVPGVAPIGAQSTTECWKFSETGKEVCGEYLDHWRTHGGLRRFGFPISGQIDAGKGAGQYIQYFERAIFKPPTSSSEGLVALASLGADRLSRKYPPNTQDTPLPALPDDTMPGEKKTFSEPWYPISGAFLRYWQDHGAGHVFGNPISPLLLEESELDGRNYLMQYFREAVFEYHPENAPPNDVLLSQLGTLAYKKAFPAQQDIFSGDWCGPGVEINDAKYLKFHSGESGQFLEPAILVFGYFEVEGLHVDTYRVRPYPGIEQPVLYTGKVTGDSMTLNIRFDLIPSRQRGLFTATRGECP